MDYFMGQVIPVAFTYAPKYFALCQGQLLPVTQNQALFSLLGTYYGGNGVQNFGLPNAMGRTIVGFGTNGSAYPLGTVGGESDHTLTINEIPSHTHPMYAQTGVASPGTSPAGNQPSNSSASAYAGASNLQAMNGGPLSLVGGGGSHTNMQPSLPINFAIALNGVFPSRN